MSRSQRQRPSQLPRRSGRRFAADDGAATSLSVALLTPVFIALALVALQAALWSHARTQARVIARDTAALVARSGVAEGNAATSARSVLSADTSMDNVSVAIIRSNGVVSVTVSADAPGMIRGTSRGLSVTVAVPIEEITPP